MSGVTDSRPSPEVDEISRILMKATSETANDLKANGNFSEARAEGNLLIARAGKQTFAARNRAAKGPPGNRERMLHLYTSMVVRNLIGRANAEGEGGG